MPRIPYNPTRQPVRPQSQGRVNASGAINAIGREAASQREVARMFQGAIDTGMAARKQKVAEDTDDDNLGFEVAATNAELELNKKLDAIPVAEGVKYREEAERAKEDYLEKLNSWIDEENNVQHEEAKSLFKDRIAEINVALNERIGEGEAEYKKQFAVGNAKVALETGIKIQDEDMIRRAADVLHRQKVSGYVNEKERDLVYEKSVEKMKQIADQDRLEQFESAKMDGDWEQAKEIVNSLEGPGWTDEKKDNFIRKERSRAAWKNSTEMIPIAEESGMRALDELEKSFEEKNAFTEEHGPLVRSRINAARDRLESSQISNERALLKAFERGEGNWSEYERMKELDTAGGLTPDAEKALKPFLEEAESQYEMNARFERDEQSVAYKSMLDELAANRFGKTSTGRIDTNDPDGKKITPKRRKEYQSMLDEINALPVGRKAKARLLDEWLQVRATDLIDPGKEDPRGFFSIASEISNDEANLRGELIGSYRALLADGMVPEGFGQSVKKDDERVAEFFRKTKDPTPEQLEKLRQDVLGPLEGLTMRRKVRRDLVREAPQPLPGDIEKGFRYFGGDPANPESWEEAN